MREFTLKKKWDRLLLTLLFSVAVCTAAFAQERTVSGKVVDAKTHETIIGASIKVKGTPAGTVTDLNGNFKIATASDATLQISYIGYISREITADFSKPMEIYPI